ncbi:MAG: hypothetical protein LUG99_14670 [Lachnospiraceae bacterium]|nr:hypothetical protein [Lachnospiraceae bacterium]
MNMNELLKVMNQMDWELFVKQKEWLYSQLCYLEKWYGAEASALPEGILNMMGRIQNVWEMGGIDNNGVPKEGCWYDELWFDEDLEIALENAEIQVTDQNVARLKRECLHIFDDKSERNEMLADKARSIFDT